MSYQPKPETEEKAISYLRGKSNVKPLEMATAISISKRISQSICIYLHTKGKLLRDGRSYTWNPIDAAAADRIYDGRVSDMLGYVEEKIINWGQHNKKLSNAFRNGESDSWVTGRKWTDNLKKIRTGLRNCVSVQNNSLLIILEQELSKECPTWMSDLYKHSEYAQQQLTDERRMAYAARKRRPLDEDFFAVRQDKVDARKRAAREAREEADRLLQLEAVTMLAGIGAAQDEHNLNFALQILQDLGPQKASRFLPSRPLSPEDAEMEAAIPF